MFTIEQINAAIEAMSKAQGRVQKTVAQVIVMAAWAANVNSDAGVANALMKNLRKGTRKQGITACLEHIANLANVSGTFVFFDAKKDYSEESAKAIKIAASTWEEFKPKAPDAKSIDVAEELDAFVQRLNRASSKDLLTHAPLLVRLQQLNAEIKGELVFEAHDD
jgi:hypothetical protein